MLLTIALNAALAGITDDGELQNTAVPTHQRIELEIVPGRRAFKGRTVITLDVQEPTESVTLHAKRLFIQRATLGGKATVSPEPGDAITITPKKPLQPGKAELVLEFSGKYGGAKRFSPLDEAWNEAQRKKREERERLEKSYREQGKAAPQPTAEELKAEQKERKEREKALKKNPDPDAVVWAHFDQARQIVPCFDEPHIQTRFEVVIRAPEGMTVLASTPEAGSEPGKKGLVVHRFEPTPPMPVSGLGFVVGKLQSAETPQESPPGAIYHAGAEEEVIEALGDGLAEVTWMEERLGPAPFPKRDGFVTPNRATASTRVGAAGLVFASNRAPDDDDLFDVLHHAAHDWLGRAAVTGWEDRWLVESLARSIAMRGGSEDAIAEVAAAVTAQGRTPGVVKSECGKKCKHLDGPASKSEAVFWMLEEHLGSDAFWKAVRGWSGDGGRVTVEGFYGALGEDAVEWVQPWMEQKGIPLVTFRREGSILHVSQEPFYWTSTRPLTEAEKAESKAEKVDGVDPEDADEGAASPEWVLPLTLRTSGGVVRARVPAEGGTVEVGEGWMMPRFAAYVWKFADPADFDALLEAVEELDPAERAQFAANLEGLVRAGGLDSVRALRAVQKLGPSVEPASIEALLAAERAATAFLDPRYRPQLEAFRARWFPSAVEKIGPEHPLYRLRAEAGDEAAQAAFYALSEPLLRVGEEDFDRDEEDALFEDLPMHKARTAMRYRGLREGADLQAVAFERLKGELRYPEVWVGAAIGASNSPYLRKKLGAWFFERPDNAHRLDAFLGGFDQHPDELRVLLLRKKKDLGRVAPAFRGKVARLAIEGLCDPGEAEELVEALEGWSQVSDTLERARRMPDACATWRAEEQPAVLELLAGEGR